MDAVLLHDSVWVLPATPQTRENFRWLATEILEYGSEATIWEGQCLLPWQDEELVRRFLAQVEDEYRVILHELTDVDADLSALARRYQSLQARDYFHSELGQEVRRALLDAAGGVDP